LDGPIGVVPAGDLLQALNYLWTLSGDSALDSPDSLQKVRGFIGAGQPFDFALAPLALRSWQAKIYPNLHRAGGC